MKLTLKGWLAQNGYSSIEEAVAEVQRTRRRLPGHLLGRLPGRTRRPLPARRPFPASGSRIDLTGGDRCRPNFL